VGTYGRVIVAVAAIMLAVPRPVAGCCQREERAERPSACCKSPAAASHAAQRKVDHQASSPLSYCPADQTCRCACCNAPAAISQSVEKVAQIASDVGLAVDEIVAPPLTAGVVRQGSWRAECAAAEIPHRILHCSWII
jgi:hypothetical protein